MSDRERDELIELGARALYDLRDERGIRPPVSRWPPTDMDEADDYRLEAAAVIGAIWDAVQEARLRWDRAHLALAGEALQRDTAELEARVRRLEAALEGLLERQHDYPTDLDSASRAWRDAFVRARNALSPDETAGEREAEGEGVDDGR